MLSDKLQRLTRLLEGNRDGFTRDQLSDRLGVTDREARLLISELTTLGVHEREARLLISELTTLGIAPVVCDRATGEGRYRIAQAHEWDAINAECAEDASRAIKLHQRATGRRRAFTKRYSAGDLFLREVPPLEDVA